VTWWFEPGEVVYSPPGSSVVIATGARGLTAAVTPALPGGRSLTISDIGLVAIVAPSGAPPIDLTGAWLIELTS
jgi:hypothetical protein